MTPRPTSGAPAGGARRFLTFRLDERLYALPAEEVAEVIRTPAVARVPQGPASLLGMANLRGAVLPVASLGACWARPRREPPARAIVLSGAAPVALAVDAVDALVTVDAARLETDRAELAAEPGEALQRRLAGSAPATTWPRSSTFAACWPPRSPRGRARRGRSAPRQPRPAPAKRARPRRIGASW